MTRCAITSLIATAGTVCTVGSVFGQSFNVDLGAQAGAGSGAIASSFAACGQAGSWNVIWPTTQPDATLVNTAGVMTAVTLTRPAGVTVVVPPGNSDTGDFGRLMTDGFRVNTVDDTDHYTFNGLTEGRYLVYVYFANTASGIGAAVDVSGFVGQSMQLSGGSTPDTFKAGANYTLSLADVSANGQLSMAITRLNGGQANVAGFSLVKLNGTRKPIHITPNGAGDRSGSSWTNAMAGVIEPMQLLNGAYYYETETTDNTVDLDMWIAGGTYKVTSASNPTRFERLNIIDGMSMYGGFSGNESHPAQRTGIPQTIISGEIGNAGMGDNSYKLANYDKCSSRTITDRLTFAHAADERVSVSLYQGRGAAVMVMESNDPFGNDGPVFRDVIFRNNLAGSEGGAIYLYNASTTFENCLFEDNDTLASNSEGKGGAVADYSGGSTYIYTDFISNSSKKGAAAYLRFSGAEFFGCRFLGNQGSTSTIHILNGQDSRFGSCLIAGNSNGLNAAAVYSEGENADVRFSNTTIGHNSAAGYSAGVLLRDGADGYVLNSIIWGNSASLTEPGFEGQASIDVVNGPTSVAFAHASVQNGSKMEVAFNTALFQNNELNPLFVDFNGTDNVLGTIDDNYRLSAGSPAIDSGEISFAPTDTYDLDADGIVWEEAPYDLAGRTRVVDISGVGASGYANVIDRGPYEFTLPCRADLNGDGVLNFFDVQAFLSAFSGGSMVADFVADGVLNFFDVQEFLNQFSAGCP
ncbi:MAG: hypothetical protein KJZ65_09805 [Phycisphaerales bacterium]|nr:hypothetical protein [Phycisphaerales bacterium]